MPTSSTKKNTKTREEWEKKANGAGIANKIVHFIDVLRTNFYFINIIFKTVSSVKSLFH